MVTLDAQREDDPTRPSRLSSAPRPRGFRRPTAAQAATLGVAVLLLGLPGAIGAGPLETPTVSSGGVGDVPPAAVGGHFEPNLGQFPEHVRFVVRGAGVHAFLTDDGAAFVLREAPATGTTEALGGPLADSLADPFADPLAQLGPPEPAAPASLFAVFLRFEDADPGPMEGTEPRPGISNHFIGNDPDKWVTNVPHYGRVVQRDVWPGIDIEWHIAPQGLKFDAVVQPGAEPKLVRFTLPGAQAMTLDAAGDLLIATPLGELVKEAPYTYQDLGEGPREVPSRYVIDGGVVGFEVGDHDPSRPLVIDPLVYSTYLGGVRQAEGRDVAVDDDGHAYVTGSTDSGDFPRSPGAFQPNKNGGWDAFITKLTPTGNDIVFSTYLGGGGGDFGHAISVDLHGNVHLAGLTFSTDFPTETTFQAAYPGPGAGIAFYTRLNATDGSLESSTYLGGEDGAGIAYGIAVDADGSAYVVGSTSSMLFPTTTMAAYPAFPSSAESAAFVTKFMLGEDGPSYSTFLGNFGVGSFGHRASTAGHAIAVDAQGSAYVTGGTFGPALFPTSQGAFQTTRPSGADNWWSGFVTKFTPGGDGVMYSTYLGGTFHDYGYGIVVDGDGHAYVTGATMSANFATKSAFQAENPPVSAHNSQWGRLATFLTKMNPDGTGVVYSTYIGGNGHDAARPHPVPVIPGSGFSSQTPLTGDVAVDAGGNAYVAGVTTSMNLAEYGFIVNAYQAERGGSLAGSNAAFVLMFPPDGSAPVWGTYLGGSGADYATGIAVASTGSAYVTGTTRSNDFPTTPGAFQAQWPGTGFSNSAFVSKLYGVHADFEWSDPCPGEPITFQDRSFSHRGVPLVRSEWDFGDGGRQVFDPWRNGTSHTYLVEGSYQVTVAASETPWIRGSTTNTVTVPWCPPPNHAPSLLPMPCVVASPEQKLSFQVRATVPVLTGDPSSYSNLTFFAEGLPSGATFQQDAPLAARITWVVGPPDTYTFVVHVDDEGLPEHDVPSLGDSREYCIEVRPDKPAPGRDDDSGDGAQNWHDACPHVKNPDQADAADGLDDPCEPAAPPKPEATPEEAAPPPDGCPAQPAGPREVTARWTDGAVQITWQSDSWCPPDHFLVWNGTGHHLVDFVVAEAGIQYAVLNLDPWPEPHQYYVQAMGADEGLFFDPTRAVGSNLIDPSGCILEGARSEACLPLGIGEESPAAVVPAAPEAAAPADGHPVGLIAAAVALVVGGLTALLWRLRHAPWVVHLFSRLGPEDVLDHPVRARIAALVQEEPGLHSREIQRRIGKGRGAVCHHLQVLAEAGVVAERRTGQYVCYYPAEGMDHRVHGVGGLLRSNAARRLLRLLWDEPGLGVAELARRLQADQTTVRYHLRRFEAQDLARVERGARNSKVYPGALTKDALAALVP